MARLRVALAGAGMVSRHHLLAWSRLETAEVVALADPDRARAAARAAEFGIGQVFDDVPAMLDGARPAALDVAAPMATHGALVRAAAARGIDVLCQKPLAPTLAEARALAAEVAGRIRLMVHENWRFRPHYRRIARWLHEERIGRPRAFRLDVLGSGVLPESPGSVPHGLLRQPFLAGMERLLVLELLVHHLDLLRFLLGRSSW
jgi:predicted dehydrogenase